MSVKVFQLKTLHLVTNAHSNTTPKYSSKNTDGANTMSA